MKWTTWPLVSSLIIAHALVLGCHYKKAPHPPAAPEEAPQVPDGWGLNNTLVVDENQIFCAPPALNCFDEIIVTPQYSHFRAFEDAVEREQTADFFQGDRWRLLFPPLEEFPEQLKRLQEGVPLLRFEEQREGISHIHYLATERSRYEILEEMRNGEGERLEGIEFSLTLGLRSR